MAIPLIGSLKERRIAKKFLPSDLLRRRGDQLIGTPKSTFSAKPSVDELKIIANDLAEKVFFEHDGNFHTRGLDRGQVLVNE
eukprot:2054572-Ditylum_brightwellii.AAC.1